jgi:hypothetical protein
MRERARCSQAAKSFVCPFTRGFLLRQVWERGIEIIWALAITAASFVCFINMVRVMGFWGREPRWVTYLGRCGEKGWPPVDGWLGQKKYKGSEDKKNMPFLQGPLRAEFSRVDNALYWLSLFGRGVTKGNRGKFYKSSVTRRDARTHTYGCFQFSSTLELATMGRIGRVRAWAGQVWNRGGRVGKGGRGVHSEECTGVISGLWCSWTAAGTILPLPCFCVLILSSFLFSIFVCFLFLIYFN